VGRIEDDVVVGAAGGLSSIAFCGSRPEVDHDGTVVDLVAFSIVGTTSSGVSTGSPPIASAHLA
jgi:hypothetical protein